MIRACTSGASRKGEGAALLRSQGGFIPQWSSAWRLGELSLYGDKLAFAQPGKPRFELSLATVTDVAMERRKFILLHKDAVRITYLLPNQKRPRLAWFITADPGRWFDQLRGLAWEGRARGPAEAAIAYAEDRTSRQAESVQIAHTSRSLQRPASSEVPMILREEQLEELAGTLSAAARRTLLHLWRRRHADIKELARVADSRSHMEVLTLLREDINGVAERLFGKPVLVFRERAIDRTSGRAVCYQWWLERADETGEAGLDVEPVSGHIAEAVAAASQRPAGGPAQEAVEPESLALDQTVPLVEIHDEGETVMVIVVGSGVGLETIGAPKVVGGDTLIVAMETAAGRRELSVPLPCSVLVSPLTVAGANGVASLTLTKETGEGRR